MAAHDTRKRRREPCRFAGRFPRKIRGMLETSELACERGGLRLFAALGISLSPGDLLRVRGAHGAGKDTRAGPSPPGEPFAGGALRSGMSTGGKCCFLGTRPRLRMNCRSWRIWSLRPG